MEGLKLCDCFIPIIVITKDDYDRNEDNIVEYTESEIQRIKGKGVTTLRLTEFKEKNKASILLSRAVDGSDHFKLTRGKNSLEQQYKYYINVLKRKSTILIKEC